MEAVDSIKVGDRIASIKIIKSESSRRVSGQESRAQ